MGAASPAVSGLLAPPPKSFTEFSPELLARLRIAAEYWARKFASRTAPFDDLLQEGLYAAVTATRAYRPGSLATVETFAITCIKNRMLDFVRREKRHARPLISGDTVSSEESDYTLFDVIPAPEHSVLDAVCAIDLSRRAIFAISRLPPRERYCVWGYFFRGTTHGTLARALGISRSRVIQLIQAGITRLGSALQCLPSGSTTNNCEKEEERG